MEKQKRWQLFVIIAVIILTIYNILPTLFYYSKPLKRPIGVEEAKDVAQGIAERVNHLQKDSVDWLNAFCKNLNIKPQSIQVEKENSRYVTVLFANQRDAEVFRKHLPRAGALIPFVPSQIQLADQSEQQGNNQVMVVRQLGTYIPKDSVDQFFTFAEKRDANGAITETYRNYVYDRLEPIALQVGGVSEAAQLVQLVTQNANNQQAQAQVQNLTLRLAKSIVDVENLFGDQSSVAKRYFASFTQNQSGKDSRSDSMDALAKQFTSTASRLQNDQQALANQIAKRKSDGGLVDSSQNRQLQQFENDRTTLDAANLILKRNIALFTAGQEPLTEKSIYSLLSQDQSSELSASKRQTLSLEGRNPFIQEIVIDWANESLTLVLYPDLQNSRFRENPTEKETIRSDKLNQLIVDEIARLARQTNEVITPSQDNFVLNFDQLTSSSSFLTLNINQVAQQQAQTLKNWLINRWSPQNRDLNHSNYPIYTQEEYAQLPAEQKKLALVLYAPAIGTSPAFDGLRPSSFYVIAKGMHRILEQYEKFPESEEAKQFINDFQQLSAILKEEGFFGYPATAYRLPSDMQQDYLFEQDDFYSTLIKATREDFTVHGTYRQAVLEFSNVEQRLLTLNKIEDGMHEELLKWRDEYNAARVDLNRQARFDVPPPIHSVFWDNFKLSTAKYFRGDDRKILRWGLDLSGGKTVRIGLRDAQNKPVTAEDDLRQGVNELYKRVNKMGVSEVGIRVEGSTIVLDFPGSQGLTAQELVKASSMTFHVVNEKFSPRNTALASVVNEFLQEVWNEAIVTNRKDVESINAIAWQHLGGVAGEGSDRIFTSNAAKTLWDNGLRLANSQEDLISSNFNDTLSSISMMRGTDYAEWEGQTHPLIVIFHNYALAGSSLENVGVGYDPSKGNILSFGVRNSYTMPDGTRLNPRDDFYNWTSQFCQEKIAGTPKEAYAPGSGWRMAVILNGSIINAPTLSSPLRDQAMISGHFSQREVNQLSADLKAGSLTFTPKILSEQNVSAELGQTERHKGIIAAVVAALLVVVVMVAYYRFAGIVASVAIIFNLLIMWGTLQNLDAALTLPGIAAIILTIGMAVDANVLVYERIREEYEHTKRLPSAIHAGYRKAFSAIIDSNVTTIIAALILLQFDSGPIKGFAVNLIIGIVSSMFTALFMTRYFFAGWVQNPKNKELKMARLLTKTNFDFLSKTKIAVISSLIIVVMGGVFLFSARHTIFGMDFTGGYALTVDLQEQPGVDYRHAAAKALMDHGATSTDFQIRELNKPNILRIQLSTGMEVQGAPFYNLPLTTDIEDNVYSYQSNPRIDWVVHALADNGLPVNPAELGNLEKNWTQMSGQLSDAMRNSALWGLGLSLLCILIYLSIRFEFKYAISSILGLVHDVLITIGILAMLHLAGLPIQIDLQVIAALMTIIGYSLNDTIIIFDRIREDTRLMRKSKFSTIINHSLNATLSRTIMTSGTTMVVLVALVLMGGSSIFAFSLVMTIGVIVGTLSSLFVAAPLLLYFHKKESDREESELTLKKV
ncbi:MAG: protein translocase subunit SecD [Parachlamydiales bacterium]|nr:protein translocase subunit SecD [Parachlamydiales bacterium]